MTAQETNVSNGAESTLSSALSSGATTINVTATTSFPSVPFYAVIDPDDDSKREVVLVDSSKSATTFVLSAASKRGLDGTTDTTHDSGAKVVQVPVGALWADINDRVDAAYTAGSTDVAVADGGTGASTAAAARTNLGVAIGSDVQAHSAVLDATTASFLTADETKLDGIAAGATDDTTVNTHIADAADAHDASAISIADAGGYFTSTDVEGALQEAGVGGSDRGVFGGFASHTNLVTTATQLIRLTASSTGQPAMGATPVVVDRAGSLTGVSVAAASARTSGSITFEVYKGGVATGLSVTLDGTNTQHHYATQASGLDTLAAGDRLDVRATNTSFGPSTSFEAFVTVEFD